MRWTFLGDIHDAAELARRTRAAHELHAAFDGSRILGHLDGFTYARVGTSILRRSSDTGHTTLFTHVRLWPKTETYRRLFAERRQALLEA
jgi:hypothetical protein